jgi:DNA-binding transcriptional LysR family regulator
MQDLNDLFYFSIVVEQNGFAAAGRALGIPKSRLSRRISQLEERLGVRLLQRSTRRFAVTDAGQRFYRHCQAVIAEAQAAEEAVAQLTTEPRGLVRIAALFRSPERDGRNQPGSLQKYPQVKL